MSVGIKMTTPDVATEVAVALRTRANLPSYIKLAKIKEKTAEPKKKSAKIKYYTVENP